MKDDLRIIKKKYGEKMMHLCRELFPTLLDEPGYLSNLMISLFEPTRFLYEDIILNKLEEKFKDYVYSHARPTDTGKFITDKTPKELLEEAGYDLYECKTEEEIQSFKKYYKSDEEICTFEGGRLNKCYVFFAVKKKIDEIKRENFKNPQRDDEYGTSVISIQFSRGTHNTLSIKNRYNHTVKNPDSTFSNNLDSIIIGLTDSFEKEYNLNLEYHKFNFNIPGYVKADDGKFYKYNYETNNIYYCTDNIIIDNYKVIKKYQDKEKYLIIDYFVLDLVNKNIELYDKRIQDCFPEGIKDIEKITIIKSKENGNKTIGIICKNNKIIIEVDNTNKIIEYQNQNLTKIGDYFLYYNNSLKNISLPNLLETGDNFLSHNHILTNVELPSLIKVGDWFLLRNNSLTSICLPNLIKTGNYFLTYNQILTNLNLPNLIKAGNNFLSNNTSIVELNLPNLKELGDCALLLNDLLKIISLPSLEKIGNEFMIYNTTLTQLCLPNLKEIGNHTLTHNYCLKILDLPNLIKIGNYFLSNYIYSLEYVNLPKLLDDRKNKLIDMAETNKYKKMTLQQKYY